MVTRAEAFAIVACSYVGVPYSWGGEDLKGPKMAVDCSGFVRQLLAKFGVVIPDMTAQAMWSNKAWTGRKTTTPSVGCLAFFGKPGKVTHVGVVAFNNLMVDARGGGPQIDTPEEAEWANAAVDIHPLSDRSDCIGYIQLFD